jgi:hypothetical protein
VLLHQNHITILLEQDNILISDIISFNGTTDYVEGFIFQNFGSDRDSDFGEATVFFEGFRIIE